jgi:hypothetical protein
MARAYRPPSWITTCGISVAHGILVAGLLISAHLTIDWLAGPDLAILPWWTLLIAVLAYVPLILWRPYARMCAISCWLSPTVAIGLPSLISLVADHGLSSYAVLEALAGPIFFGWPIAGVNIFTCLFVTAFLKQAGRMPVRPPKACQTCAACGYSLAGLASPRCPECGTPVAPTPPTPDA